MTGTKSPSWSSAYIIIAVEICRRFERQEVCRAFSLAWAKTGKRIAARIAMMAMTTSSSISVKPRRSSCQDVVRCGRGASAICPLLIWPEVREDVVPAGTEAGREVRLDLPQRLVLHPLDMTIDEQTVEDALRRCGAVRAFDIRLEQVPGD